MSSNTKDSAYSAEACVHHYTNTGPYKVPPVKQRETFLIINLLCYHAQLFL